MANQPASNNGRTFSILGFVFGGLAILFAPIILGPAGAVLGAVGKSKGDPLGTWAIVAALAGMVIGLGLAFLILENRGLI